MDYYAHNGNELLEDVYLDWRDDHDEFSCETQHHDTEFHQRPAQDLWDPHLNLTGRLHPSCTIPSPPSCFSTCTCCNSDALINYNYYCSATANPFHQCLAHQHFDASSLELDCFPLTPSFAPEEQKWLSGKTTKPLTKDKPVLRSYVSLSDVNSFVAQADSAKQDAMLNRVVSGATDHHHLLSPMMDDTTSTRQQKLVIKIKNPKASLSSPLKSRSHDSRLSTSSASSSSYCESITSDQYRLNGNHLKDDDDDNGSDEFQLPMKRGSHKNSTRKARNVDKACNHCKRSHLRCDDMRPCQRCVLTNKVGCRDVQHRPRGRPKLHKP